MKKIVFFIGLFLMTYFSAKADNGNCLIYHAKFYLTNGEVFNGSFEVMGYDFYANLDENGRNEFCNDKGLMDLLRLLKAEDAYRYWNNYSWMELDSDFGKIPVFKNFYAVQPEGLNSRIDRDLPNYGFISEDDLVFLDVDSLQKVIFWDVEYSPRNWFTSALTIGSQGMIDTVMTEKYWSSIFVSDEFIGEDSLVFSKYEPMWGFAMINYNPKNNVEELKRLANLKIKGLNSAIFWEKAKAGNGIEPWEDFSIKMVDEYNDQWEDQVETIKEWFWQKGILVVRVWDQVDFSAEL